MEVLKGGPKTAIISFLGGYCYYLLSIFYFLEQTSDCCPIIVNLLPLKVRLPIYNTYINMFNLPTSANISLKLYFESIHILIVLLFCHGVFHVVYHPSPPWYYNPKEEAIEWRQYLLINADYLLSGALLDPSFKPLDGLLKEMPKQHLWSRFFFPLFVLIEGVKTVSHSMLQRRKGLKRPNQDWISCFSKQRKPCLPSTYG